ncbi:MAG TPA: NADP-dependent oxidoreductase [Mycobacteriales bacterium]
MSAGEPDGWMPALRAGRRGGPEQLTLEQAPVPFTPTGEVLVAVHGAGVTSTELRWPSTWVDRLGRERAPVVPGHDVSGVVAALGFGTTGFSVGDPVFGVTDWYRDGSAAAYVSVEARNLAPKPATLGHLEAACLPLAGSTAWQALFDHGRLRAGQSVLIHGAAGGVGVLAVQIAHSAGAEVIATARNADRALLEGLGAHRVIDTAGQQIEDLAGPVDLVLDLAGGELAERSWPLVRAGGALVSVVTPRPAGGAPRPDARWVFFVVDADRRVLAELARSVDAGELCPVLGAVFPLAQGRQAFEAKLRGGIPGKVVMSVEGTP